MKVCVCDSLCICKVHMHCCYNLIAYQTSDPYPGSRPDASARVVNCCRCKRLHSLQLRDKDRRFFSRINQTLSDFPWLALIIQHLRGATSFSSFWESTSSCFLGVFLECLPSARVLQLLSFQLSRALGGKVLCH